MILNEEDYENEMNEMNKEDYYDNDRSVLTGKLSWNNTSEHNYNFFDEWN